MNNSIKIKRRGELKYYATEIPVAYRREGEGRTEIMARSREELDEKYQQEIAARKQGLEPDGGRITLSDFLTIKFLPFCRNEVELQSWNDYRLHIETNIIPLIGQVTLTRLGTREVDHWLTTLRQRTSERTGKPLSERTVEYSLAVLRRALQFAVDWRYMATNPASQRMRMAKRRRRIRPSKIQFLMPAQANALLRAVKNQDQEALYALALTTGMRAGELFALMWSDVNLDTCRLTVNRALAQTKRKKGEEGERFILRNPKTFGSRRTIDIPKVAVEALRRHRLRQQELRFLSGSAWMEQDYVFTSKVGTPLDSCNALHRLHLTLEANHLPKIRFYDLRHTHASLLISEGVHAKKIAERLGHASIKLTMDTYGHLFEGSDQESAERMDRIFNGFDLPSGAQA